MQLDDMSVIKRKRKKRVKDPTRVRGLPFVWVAYAWSPRYDKWYLLAFVRGSDKMSIKRATRLRARFGVPDRIPVRYVELFTAAAVSETGDPEINYGLRREATRRKARPDPAAVAVTFPRPNVFPKRRLPYSI